MCNYSLLISRFNNVYFALSIASENGALEKMPPSVKTKAVHNWLVQKHYEGKYEKIGKIINSMECSISPCVILILKGVVLSLAN
jgi:hypothetical protein